MNHPLPFKAKLQPPSIILMGASGSGKTYSLSTLIESGLEIFLISTEPHGLETMLDVMSEKKLSLDKLHWRYISPARPGFEKLQSLTELVSRSDQKSLSDAKPTLRNDAQMIELLKAFNEFVDEKDGKAYGKLNALGPKQAVVLDSLSGLSKMAMDVTIGDKMGTSPGEWGTAMKLVESFLLSCVADLNCFFILLSHTEREDDPVNLGNKVMVSTLGKKLAPKIPIFFSEVILADTVVEGDKKTFIWSTNSYNVVLKHRSLPIGSKLPPTFKPIVEAYNKRLSLIS